MSVTALTGLAELTSSQSLGQNSDTSVTPQPVQPEAALTSALPTDSFTPSTQNGSTQATAQDAGLFEVSQLALSSATATVLSAQTVSPQATQNTASVRPVQTGANDTATVVVAATTAGVQNPAPPPIPAATPANGGSLGEPQALNSTLLGLGLSNSDVQYIDHIASSINNFDPAIYNNLVQQFQLQLAQQSATPVVASTPATRTKVTEP
jgi:hypothetical protein